MAIPQLIAEGLPTGSGGGSGGGSNSPTISGGVLTLDLSLGRFFTVALNANITTLTLTNVPAGNATFDLMLTQDATGGRTVTWPGSFAFLGGNKSIVGPAPNNIGFFRFFTPDGGTTWTCASSLPVTSFSPYFLFGLLPSFQHYWFDFTDKAYLFQDTACTTPVTAAGQSIAAIKDKLATGMILTQATSGKRPIYREASGIGYAEFSTSAQSALVTTAVPWVISQQNFNVVTSSRFENSGSASEVNYGLWSFMSGGPVSVCEPFLSTNSLRKAYGYYNHGGSGDAGGITFTNSQDNQKAVVSHGSTGTTHNFKGVSEDGQTITGSGTRTWSLRSSNTLGIGYYDPSYTSSYGFNGRIYGLVGSNTEYSGSIRDAMIAFLKTQAGF